MNLKPAGDSGAQGRPRSGRPRSGSGRWEWPLLAGILAVGLFSQTVAFGWVYDDQMEVVRNSLVHSLSTLPQIFGSTVWEGSGMETYLYRPLTVASYALNHAISGLQSWSYHLVNVLLFAGCSGLVFRLGLLWGLPVLAAGVGATLFAIHPIHVEVVAPVFGRKDLLAAFFTLAMALSHRKALGAATRWVLAPLGFFAAALLSKEVAVMAFPFVILQDWFLAEDRKRFFNQSRAPILYSAYMALFAIYVVVRNQVTGGFSVPETSFLDNPLVEADMLVRIGTALVVGARGLLLLAAPVGLSPDYSFNSIPVVETVTDPRLGASLLGLGLVVVFVVWKGWSSRTTKLGLAWFLLFLLPTANLIVPVGTIFGERFLFLPSVAFCLLAGWAFYRTIQIRPGPSLVIGLIVAVLLGLQTARYTSVWRSDASLFSWAVQQVPESTKAHHKLGEERLRAGQLGDAVRSLRRALEIAPDNEFAAITMSQARQRILAEFSSVAPSLPQDADVLYILAQARNQAGDMDGAVALWEEAVGIHPRHAESLGDLGAATMILGDTVGGIQYLERAVDSKPDHAVAWLNLGRIHLSRGDRPAAQEALVQFLEHADARLQQEIDWARAVLESSTPR